MVQDDDAGAGRLQRRKVGGAHVRQDEAFRSLGHLGDRLVLQRLHHGEVEALVRPNQDIGQNAGRGESVGVVVREHSNLRVLGKLFGGLG
jgi:hypothetical protein